MPPTDPVASAFLLVTGVGFLLVYGLPLLLVPRRWARWFRWRVEDGPLCDYFARCLGAVAVAITVSCLRAAAAPERHADLFELIGVAAVLLAAVHVRGALRRAQPWTEDAEILLYAAVAALAFWLRAGL
jgi:hypothetical protein